MATLTYKTLATNQKDGPLVSGLTPGDVAVLAANFTAGTIDPAAYANFVRLSAQMVNAAVKNASVNAPEGERMVIVVTGLSGQAYHLASGANSAFAKGQIAYNGEVIAPWPEYPNAVAFVRDANTLILRWVKKGPELVWIIVGVLVAIGIYLVYQLLKQAPYSLSSANPQSGTGANQQGTGIPSASGILDWIITHPAEDLLILGGAVGLPFLIREIASTREGVNEYRAAEHGYFPGERGD